MYIIYKTVINILQRKDINAPNHVTAEKFKERSMSKPLILIGKGGHSKVIKDIIESEQQYHIAGYLDNAIDEYYTENDIFLII